MPTYYIAGPMRGYPLSNFPMFDKCRDDLIRLGHTPLNPADNDRALGFDPTVEPPLVPEGGFDMERAFQWDISSICARTTDGIVLLPGWEKSVGANIEHDTCKMLGKTVMLYDPETGTINPEKPSAFMIGLSGHGEVGKDVVGEVLQREGFVRVAKGDLIKRAMMQIDPWVELQRSGDHLRVSDLMWSGKPWLEEMDRIKALAPDARLFMQQLADQMVDVIGRDIWTERVWEIVDEGGLTKVVNTRISLPVEAQAIKARGGEVWRIERPGYGPINNHPNEVALDDWPFDRVIVNDGTVEDLEKKVLVELDRLGMR